MWTFKGYYTGEAKAYVQKIQKKHAIIESIILSVVCLVFGLAVPFILSLDVSVKDTSFIIGATCGVLGALISSFIIFLCYIIRSPKTEIDIINDGIKCTEVGARSLLPFYSIRSIEFYDEFIAIDKKLVLQKDLLVKGEWEELLIFLKEVEESLDTDNPIYQIEEPETQFIQATVKSKRIFKRFVGEVRVPNAVYDYFATFLLEDREEAEFKIGQELYETIEQGDAGTLVLINGKVFSFGEGEDIE